MTITELVQHYNQNELPRLAHSSQKAYQSYARTRILPVWGNHQLTTVKAVAVENWLASLPLANGIFDEDSQYHVRTVLPRCTVGVHRSQPDHPRPAGNPASEATRGAQ